MSDFKVGDRVKINVGIGEGMFGTISNDYLVLLDDGGELIKPANWLELINNQERGATKVLQEAIDKANKYDDLMTPKKVKVCSFVNAKGKHIDEYHCGSCDYYIDRIKREKHCFNCGQALDWSDK